jgi:hypothetical protein
VKNLLFLFVLLLVFTLSATIINVPADQPTIQAGMTIAVEGDTVLVQPGSYLENINYNGDNITVASLFFVTQDSTFISNTIIDGDSSGSVVTFESGEDSTAVLCGFTLTNGLAEFGGGIKIYEASPKLNYLQINNNYGHYGGGICCDTNSSSIIQNTIISNNTAEGRGGGFWCGNFSNPYLENVTIDNNNTLLSKGGGIFIGYDSSPIFSSIEVTNNHSGFHGGGIYSSYNSNPIFDDAIISNNIAEGSGAGIYSWFDGLIQITNSIISGNNSEYPTNRGGGCYFIASSSAIIINVEISNNSSDFGGGIYYHAFSSSYFILENVTITENTAQSGGGIYLSLATIDLTNCIIWNNTQDEVYFNEENNPNTITVSYSDILGGESGIITNNNVIVNWLDGNIDEDPEFLGIGEYPFALQFDSPCINAGTPDTTGLNLPEYDIAGNPRISGGRIDMGAYEYQETGVTNNQLIETDYNLSNYPNPFNPTTVIEFSVQNDCKIDLTIFNIKGQKVKTITSNEFTKGTHSIIWNGVDEFGKSVSSGIYYYKLNTNGKTEAVKKCLLLK